MTPFRQILVGVKVMPHCKKTRLFFRQLVGGLLGLGWLGDAASSTKRFQQSLSGIATKCHVCLFGLAPKPAVLDVAAENSSEPPEGQSARA